MSKFKNEHNATNSARRKFTKTIAIIAAAPLVPSIGVAHIQQTQGAEAPSPTSEALAEVVRGKYKKFLTEDQLNEVKRGIDRRLRDADRLKQFALKNSDEPAFTFSASVEEPPKKEAPKKRDLKK